MIKKQATAAGSHFDVFQNEEGGSIWITSFGEESLKSFTHKFLTLEASGVDIIPIVVSSYGGSASNMQAMRDIIKTSNTKVAILALGKAMSAGCYLLAAGTHGLRFVAPNTDIMLHEIRGGSGAIDKVSDHVVNVDHMERVQEQFLKNFAKDTGRTVEQWEADMAKRNKADWYMTAEEAVALGIADHVTVPRMVSEPARSQLMSFHADPEPEPTFSPVKKSVKKKTKKK